MRSDILPVSPLQASKNRQTPRGLLAEAKHLKATDLLNEDSIIALYYDNVNFKNLLYGLRTKKSTSKDYVFASWLVLPYEQAKALYDQKLSSTPTKWSDVTRNTHTDGAAFVLEPGDQGVLDEQMIKRWASIIEVISKFKQHVAADNVAPEMEGVVLPGRSAITAGLVADIDFSIE